MSLSLIEPVCVHVAVLTDGKAEMPESPRSTYSVEVCFGVPGKSVNLAKIV